MAVKRRKTIPFQFGDKHKAYIRACKVSTYNIAEGAVRAGKTVDNVFAFAHALKRSEDKLHLASGSTMANAKLNIGDANGFGLEYIFRGQCRWGKYKDNEALLIKGPDTKNQLRIVVFAGAAKADSYKKIRGNSYGMWIATEVNLHHESFIHEAFNRTAAASKRQFYWDLNPDHPKAPIYTDYIDKYRDKALAGELTGYNYEHFTIDDNVTISAGRIAEIKAQYDPESVWYQRDILGRRMVAEGLIYRSFADKPERYRLAAEEMPEYLERITIGVDVGGNRSKHAFVATGIGIGFKRLYALASRQVSPDGTPEDFTAALVDFCRFVQIHYGLPQEIRFESAEQVLKRGAEKAILDDQTLHTIAVKNSVKLPINDRIKLTASLMAQGRFYYTDDCRSLVEALTTCVWDSKYLTQNVRLDDGTSDIDTLDAFEYSFERYAKALQMAGERSD